MYQVSLQIPTYKEGPSLTSLSNPCPPHPIAYSHYIYYSFSFTNIEINGHSVGYETSHLIKKKFSHIKTERKTLYKTITEDYDKKKSDRF